MADEHHHDPTFCRSPRDAAAAPAEKIAIATFSRPATSPDALAVVDVDPESPSYASVIGFTELPNTGDEPHHFGREGTRVYFTNSLYGAWDDQFFPSGEEFRGRRVHQVRLQGDASSDSYCYP
jgi:hypothetical protein